MVAANSGEVPTFQRGEQKSWIDLTIRSTNLIVEDWTVLKGESLSDHNSITYKITHTKRLRTNTPVEKKGWAIKNEDLARFAINFTPGTQRRMEERLTAKTLQKALVRAYNKSFSKKKQMLRKRKCIGGLRR